MKNMIGIAMILMLLISIASADINRIFASSLDNACPAQESNYMSSIFEFRSLFSHDQHDISSADFFADFDRIFTNILDNTSPRWGPSYLHKH